MKARIGAAMAGIGLVAVLTACGGDGGNDGGNDSGNDGGSDGGSAFADKSAEDIVADAKSAMGDLQAVKLAGSITTEGQDVTLDVQANDDGDCTGSIGIAGGTAELLGVGGEMWFRPDKAFWQASAGDQAGMITGLVGDKWVVIPGSDDSFGQFCDVDKLIDELIAGDDTDSKYTKAGTEDLDGDEVVRVDSSDDDGEASGYVRVDDPHYLVKVERTKGDDTGEVVFSEFDEEFSVEAPAKDEVVDLDKLGG